MHAYKVFDYHEKSQLSATPGKAVLEKTRQEANSKLNKVVEELKITREPFI